MPTRNLIPRLECPVAVHPAVLKHTRESRCRHSVSQSGFTARRAYKNDGYSSTCKRQTRRAPHLLKLAPGLRARACGILSLNCTETDAEACTHAHAHTHARTHTITNAIKARSAVRRCHCCGTATRDAPNFAPRSVQTWRPFCTAGRVGETPSSPKKSRTCPRLLREVQRYG